MTGHHSEQIMLLAQLITGQRLPDSVPPGDWQGLLDAAEAQGVLEIVCGYIRQQPADFPTAEAHAAAGKVLQLASVRTVLLARAWDDTCSRLKAAGIPLLAVKGIALAYLVYAQPFLRPMVDLDLVVPVEFRAAALQMLLEAGYVLDENPVDTLFAQSFLIEHDLTHHYVLSHPLYHVTIELHFRLLSAFHSHLADEQMGYFWQHTRSVTVGQRTFLTLENELHALYLCAHIILQHGEYEFRLLRYVDLYHLLLTYTLDWDVFCQHAGYLGWSDAAFRSLNTCQQLFGGDIIAPTVLERLEHQRSEEVPPLPDDRVAFLFEIMQQRLAAQSWQVRLTTIWQIVMPSAAYMRYRYQIPEQASVVPYYVRRWWYIFRSGAAWLRDRLHHRAK